MTEDLQNAVGGTITSASQQNALITLGILAFVAVVAIIVIAVLVAKGKISLPFINNKKSDESNNKSKETNRKTSNKEKINILKRIIADSVKSGYERCMIRQELFDEQVSVMNNNLGVILSTIASNFKNKCGGDINIQYYIESLFDEKICIRLKQIFKKDNLATKTEEQVIDSNRDIIDDTFTNIKNDLSMRGFDNEYIKTLDISKEILNDKIKFILKEARRLAREKKEALDELHNNFASEQKMAIMGFIDVDEEDLKELTSTLSLPPNDIIGEMN